MPIPHATTDRISDRWRGSPNLAAQIARSAVQAIETPDRSPVVSVSVWVDGDCELFDDADRFVDRVTREALRGFRSIRIHASDSGATNVDVVIARKAVDEFKIMTMSMANPGKGVFIRYEGDEGKEAAVLKAVSVAASRGCPRAFDAVRIVVVLALAFIASLATIAVMLSQPVPRWDWAPALALLAGVPGGIWLYPSVEVAPYGQSRLARAVKFVGVPLAGLLIVAAANWLADLDVSIQ